jgi:hypothetical protein
MFTTDSHPDTIRRPTALQFLVYGKYSQKQQSHELNSPKRYLPQERGCSPGYSCPRLAISPALESHGLKSHASSANTDTSCAHTDADCARNDASRAHTEAKLRSHRRKGALAISHPVTLNDDLFR